MKMEVDNGIRLLLVDDEADARRQIVKYLKLELPSLECLEAENGAAALEMLKEYDANLILSDINMPKMDGFTLLKQVKLAKPKTQFIIFTGREDSEAPVQALKLGASDYIRKPVNMNELIIAIERAMERLQMADELDKYQKHLEELVELRTVELKAEIAENRLLEAQMRQAQKLEAVGTLAGGIAHDFNNVLQGIIGYAELAGDEIAKGTVADTYLSNVLMAAKRAAELVRQILMFSRRTESKQMKVLVEPIVKETLQFLHATISKSISIVLKLDASDAVVMADPVYIHQVLLNLCTNAAQAMNETGGILEVSMRKVRIDDDTIAPDLKLDHGEYLLLSVKDTGIGMSAEVMERIFEPFFTTKEIGTGTGLGLSVVHGIVIEAGGSISVKSAQNEGSSFDVYWPLAAQQQQSESVEHVVPATGQGERILFVDDEPQLVELGKLMLQKLGYEVVGMTNAKRALDLFKSNPNEFDLLITDQVMPELSGLNLAHEMLKIRAGFPVVLCTGFSQIVFAENASVAGINTYIEKPLSLGELAAAVRSTLDDSTKPWDGHYKRILLAVSNDMLRFLLHTAIQRAGYTVDDANNHADATRMLNREPYYDLLIVHCLLTSDYWFAKLAEDIKANPSLKVILVARTPRCPEGKMMPLAEMLGAERVLFEPVSKQNLLTAIGKALGSAGMREAVSV